MTPDEKRENVKNAYDVVIDYIVFSMNHMKSRPEEIQNLPRNKHTMTALDELVGHLQTRREKMIAKVK